eukprot:TCONS_00059266-protein
MTLHKREEVFEKSPYDPTSGFTIFWDFLHVPTTTDQSENTMYHISVTLYKGQNKVSETRNLPVLHQNNGNGLHERAFGFGNDGTTPGFVTISVKQIFPKCFPSEDISLIVSLQITKNDVIHNNDGFQDNDQPMRSLQMGEYGWCKLTLFDSFNRVTCGRWKCPIRAGAIQLEMSQGDMNSIPQLGQSELYYRLINSRDVETQDNVILNHQHLIQYKYTPIESKHIATIFHQQPPIQAALPPPIKPNSPPVRTPFTQHPPDVLNLSTNTNSKSKKWRNRNIKTASNLSPLQTQGSQPNYSFNSTLPEGATSSKTINSPIAQPMNSPGEFSNDRIPEDEEIEHVAKSPDVVLPSIECDVGIQIDKLVNFQANEEVRVVLSIRNPNGKVTFCNDGEAILTTPWKRSTFLENTFVFGLHQKFFQATQLFQRSIIFVEIFEKQIYESQNLMDDLRGQSSTRSFDSEKLIGWGLFKLFEDQNTNIGPSLMSTRNNRTTSASVRNASNQGNSLHESMLRFGYLDIPLYQPPLPNKIKTTIKKLLHGKMTSSYRLLDHNGYVTLNCYKEVNDKLLFSKLLPPEPMREQYPEKAWIKHQRSEPPNQIFKNGNGFDFYVDTGKFFPDSTAATKVMVCLFDGNHCSKKSPFSKQMETNLKSLENYSEEPVLDTRFEFRDFAYDPRAKFVIMVYILNAVTSKVDLLGYSVIPIFMKPDSFEAAEQSSRDYCLNKGHFQLRLYQYLDDRNNYSVSSLRGPIPCASVLVRLLPAALYADGQCKTAREIPEDEWINEGIYVPMPSYAEGEYESASCEPTNYESELLHYFVSRKTTKMVDKVRPLAAGDGKKKQMSEQWLKLFLAVSIRDITLRSKVTNKKILITPKIFSHHVIA